VAEVGSDASSVASERKPQGEPEQRDLAGRKPRFADAIDGGEKANRCVSLVRDLYGLRNGAKVTSVSAWRSNTAEGVLGREPHTLYGVCEVSALAERVN